MAVKSDQYGFRVFLSYAHADRLLVEKMAAILEEIGLKPLWDVDINPGKAFTDEIKDLITRSHLFIPVITENSQHRPWVHQETGFAIALNIPILPITIGGLPSEMISSVQSVSVQPDLSDLAAKLIEIELVQLVLPSPSKPFRMVEIADWPETRAELMVSYANWVINVGEYGLVRIQSRLGIFSVPDQEPDNPIWQDREGDQQRSKYFHHLQQKERQIFERHARMAGCRLLIDPFAVSSSSMGPLTQETRLKIMQEFLESMPDDKVEVVISQKAQDTNLAIIGDYFSAESMVSRAGMGYLQTIFQSHAPTVLRQVREFDQLFGELKAEQDTSRINAINQIQTLRNNLSRE